MTDYFDAIDASIENAIFLAIGVYPQKAPWYKRIFKIKSIK